MVMPPPPASVLAHSPAASCACAALLQTSGASNAAPNTTRGRVLADLIVTSTKAPILRHRASSRHTIDLVESNASQPISVDITKLAWVGEHRLRRVSAIANAR